MCTPACMGRWAQQPARESDLARRHPLRLGVSSHGERVAASVTRFGLSSTRARCRAARCRRVERGRISRAARGYAAADEASTADEALASETPRARGWDEHELGAPRRHYAREGWVVVRRLVTTDEVDALHAATDALQAEASAFTRSRRERGVYFEVQSASGRKGDPAVAPGGAPQDHLPSKRSRAFASLTTNANVRAVCAQLCGVSDGTAEEGSAARSPGSSRSSSSSSSMRCVVDQVNLKQPLGAGTGFPWHQDVSFLKPDARGRVRGARRVQRGRRDGPFARRATAGSSSSGGPIVSAKSFRRRGMRTTARRVFPATSSTFPDVFARVWRPGTRYSFTPRWRTGPGRITRRSGGG